MNNNNHGGGFMNGFLWGAIIGSLAVFLLGTKKGKNILKLISEESFELSELFGGEEDDLPADRQGKEQSEHNKCAHCKEKAAHIESETVEVKNSDIENGEVKAVSSPKRFFRGIPKKS